MANLITTTTPTRRTTLVSGSKQNTTKTTAFGKCGSEVNVRMRMTNGRCRQNSTSLYDELSTIKASPYRPTTHWPPTGHPPSVSGVRNYGRSESAHRYRSQIARAVPPERFMHDGRVTVSLCVWAIVISILKKNSISILNSISSNNFYFNSYFNSNSLCPSYCNTSYTTSC